MSDGSLLSRRIPYMRFYWRVEAQYDEEQLEEFANAVLSWWKHQHLDTLRNWPAHRSFKEFCEWTGFCDFDRYWYIISFFLVDFTSLTSAAAVQAIKKESHGILAVAEEEVSGDPMEVEHA